MKPSEVPDINIFRAYKLRWVGNTPEVWVYTAFGPPKEGVRGHSFLGIAKDPSEYILHVGVREQSREEDSREGQPIQ